MNIPFIKVCGIQSVEEALGSIEAGANAIGLLMGITHLAADKISDRTGKDIAAAIRGRARAVMVTHLLDVDAIVAMARDTGVDAVQIHDHLSPADTQRVRDALPEKTIIKAVHVTGPHALDDAQTYASVADMLLLDSRTTDRLGGTGKTHDWSISRKIVESVNLPVVLAGGLNPENVTDAIAQVGPAGIDANSGLEHADGSKDFAKIRAFADAGAACSFKS